MSTLPAASLAGPPAGLDHAKLPALYKAAVSALRECHLLDEIKGVADKHAGIAHYAEQAKDKTLLWYAQRIQLRAFERIGELLSSFEDYDDRKRLAAANGISAVMANRAYEAAHIPRRVRDKLIEATPPPSRTRLSKCGEGYMPQSTVTHGGFRRYKEREDAVKVPPDVRADDFLVTCKHFTSEIEGCCNDSRGREYTIGQLAKAVNPDRAEDFLRVLRPLMATLAAFKMNLPVPS